MNLLVLGLQWGDEGKGKAIDFLAHRFDVVVRYQGGHNAGHTIYYKGQKKILHLLPSGIFTPNTVSVIAHGVVINPLQLVKEIETFKSVGISPENLIISTSAPLILPFHQALDIVFENSRYQKIGTTRRGIGPAYEDLVGRRSLFIRDLFDRDKFLERVTPENDYYNRLIRTFDGEEIHVQDYVDKYVEAGKYLEPFCQNTIHRLHQFSQEKNGILFEGAQGALLDINLGSYPFVTSSNPTIGGLFTGTGLSHKSIDRIVGISKSYQTRVGGGPFPSELWGAEAEFLREQGQEFGSTTGRPRRVGWLDLVALKYATTINGVDSIFLTKMDVLDLCEEVKTVVAYRQADGSSNMVFDPISDSLEQVKPIFKTFSGWQTDISRIGTYEKLPAKAKEYIRFIEDFIDIPIETISVGSARNQTISRD